MKDFLTKKAVPALMATTMLVNIAACGTILHPERKGQKGGQIDIKIAVLDGIGLLFFLIPGVIAYAVDFNNGTIYLPGGHASTDVDTDVEDMKAIRVGKENLTEENIRRVVEANTGKTIAADAEVQTYEVTETGERRKL